MKLRKITSLTLFFSSVLLLISCVVVYIVPYGRIADWSQWRMLGLSKTEWTNLHINLGILFVVLAVIHVVLNWRHIVSYMKNRKTSAEGRNLNVLIALLITVFFTIGSLYKVPPMSWFINLSESMKVQSARKCGEPPYGHAELSTIADFSWKMGLDVNQSLDTLEKAGITVDRPDQTLLEIAEKNQISPREIFVRLGGDELRPQSGYFGRGRGMRAPVGTRKFRNRDHNVRPNYSGRRSYGRDD